ncbi:ABC transporter substrate-binding protein [Nocardioides baekrokdamisoli]|uniref:ABC transporter substrate-binding protein n=1 Tax=Nocardioides baekrokdamisoli TaxID=1804624 RepID=A0A3G9IUU0_9ACTN|nr:MlaD family protein [Nocardioides baekrokdamisoli]BBH15993.1 ABC transporter substrate-binding protein [Nocardioides baekrokdamisoli]
MTGLRTVIVKFSIFAAVSALLLFILLNTMLNPVSGATNTYYAKFQDVSGLRVGDDIKVAGVRVGRVSAIRTDPGANGSYDGAVVSLQMQRSQPIPTNADLIMRYQNLVGQRYLSIQFQDANGNAIAPATTSIQNGGWIDKTDKGFDLTDLLNGFQPLFKELKPEDVNTLSSTLIQVLQGEGPTVESLLVQTGQLTTFVANRDKVIGSVLDNLTPVLQDFAAHDADLRTTVLSLKDMFTSLANDRLQIGGAIDGLSNLVVTTNSILGQVKAPLEGTVAELRQAADMLAASRTNLVNGINGFRTAISGIGRATSYENALNIYVCDLSIAVGGLPAVNPGNPANGSAVCK